jgi:peptidyl-dipeptidase Dcp
MTKLQRFTSITGPLVAAAAVAGCATLAPVTTESARPAAESGRFESVLLDEWHGPYGGLPPFDRVEVAHFEPAFEVAMAEHLAEIERIAADPSTPTFENTIAGMERAGRTLRRVMAVYGVWSANMATSEFQAAQRVIEPRLAAFRDRITQNEPLFRRIEAVYETRETAGLTPEQQRLTWLTYTNFVRAGARLDAAAKARLSAINQRLAELFTEFNQNVLADESEQYLLLEREADLAGLPESLRDAAAAAAEERGHGGKWAVTNTRSSMEPFLTYAERRDLRERGFEMWAERGDGGEYDNNPIISEILALRAERAQLLGYETHAHWRLENTMAATPARARELLEAVWTPAVERVREEVADMQEIARAEGHDITIEPWDYRYYAEKVRQARYDLDQDEIMPYLQLDRLVDGMFWVAGELFGYDFAERHDVPVFHADVRVWEVTGRASGEHIGLFYFDPFARAGKRSGAWMTSYRAQERFDEEITTLVSNNSNFVKGRAGEPVLISWDDARTLFHEFGHALHGLSSNVTYPTLSGTAVVRDFVEFPSQLLEHWIETPEVLQRFAVHHRTGEPIPQELLERIQRASTFNQGFATVEYLASAFIDMDLHLAGATSIDPSAFERDALERLGMPREIIMRHRTPHFLHIFGGDSYSAGYYSYLWSDVLTADAFEAFMEGEGPWDADVAARLHRWIFSPGNTLDPADAYRAFRGRDAAVDALMRKRGFTEETPTPLRAVR